MNSVVSDGAVDENAYLNILDEITPGPDYNIPDLFGKIH